MLPGYFLVESVDRQECSFSRCVILKHLDLLQVKLMQKSLTSLLSLFLVTLPLARIAIAQAQPKLRPVPANVCPRSHFYRVSTTTGSSLKAYGDRQLKTAIASLPNNTVVLDISQAFPTFLVPGRKDPVFLNANDVKRYLVLVEGSGSRFTGQMRVKTLESGSSLNVRRKPTVWGKNEELIAGTVADGTLVTVKGVNADGIPDFFYIVAPDGTEGFVDALYLVCS